MVTIKKKQIVFLGAVLVGLGAIITIGILLYRNSLPTSSQSDYPTLPYPALVSGFPSSLSDQVSYSSLIVDATVATVLPDELRDFAPQKGTAEDKIYEKQGINNSEYTVRPIEISINDTLKGTSKVKTITMYITPVALDSAPHFKKGDRMIFMLSNYAGSGYSAVTLQDSYYYISADNRVYPAVITDLTKEHSGKRLNDFKNNIKSLVSKK